MPHEIVIRGTIGFDSEATAEHLGAALAAANGGDVIIMLSSPGGFVFEGLEMANQIRRHPGATTVRVNGLAASMASFLAVMGDTLEVEDNAVFMIHNTWGFAVGNHNDLRETADLFESLTDIIAKALAKKSGTPLEDIKALMDAETWLFGDEIEAAGFADRTLTAGDGAEDKATALIHAKTAHTISAALARKHETIPDHEKIAALLPAAPSKPTNEIEVDPMTLAEFLKANPEAQKEVDTMITDAKASVVNAATEAKKALSANVYPPAVQVGVLDMIIDGNSSGISALISVHDQLTEAANSAAAQKETEKTPETPPAEPAENDGVIASHAAVNETIERLNAR